MQLRQLVGVLDKWLQVIAVSQEPVVILCGRCHT